jgi:hypothetical protein
MFTQARNIYVAHEHHFVMVFGEDSIVNHVCMWQIDKESVLLFETLLAGETKGPFLTCEALLVAFGHPQKSLRVALGSPLQPFSVGVFANAL